MTRTKIMLVGSQPSFRAILSQVLSQDIELETTEILECNPGEDGNTVIAEIEANSPDIVLLDIGHPISNRLKLSKKISRTFPKTGVVVVSTNPEDDDNELFKVAKSGAVAYLRSKQPIGAKLIKVIKQASNGECPINNDVLNNPKIAWLILRHFQDTASKAETREEVIFPLNLEEIQVLQLIAKGDQKKQIASILGVSERTIIELVSNILFKLKSSERAHDTFTRVRAGLLALRLARDGNLFILNASPNSLQAQLLHDSASHQ